MKFVSYSAGASLLFFLGAYGNMAIGANVIRVDKRSAVIELNNSELKEITPKAPITLKTKSGQKISGLVKGVKKNRVIVEVDQGINLVKKNDSLNIISESDKATDEFGYEKEKDQEAPATGKLAMNSEPVKPQAESSVSSEPTLSFEKKSISPAGGLNLSDGFDPAVSALRENNHSLFAGFGLADGTYEQKPDGGNKQKASISGTLISIEGVAVLDNGLRLGGKFKTIDTSSKVKGSDRKTTTNNQEKSIFFALAPNKNFGLGIELLLGDYSKKETHPSLGSEKGNTSINRFLPSFMYANESIEVIVSWKPGFIYEDESKGIEIQESGYFKVDLLSPVGDGLFVVGGITRNLYKGADENAKDAFSFTGGAIYAKKTFNLQGRATYYLDGVDGENVPDDSEALGGYGLDLSGAMLLSTNHKVGGALSYINNAKKIGEIKHNYSAVFYGLTYSYLF